MDVLTGCSDPPCAADIMASVSPMHPHRYLDLACDEHRRRFVESSPVFADYVPDDGFRELGRG